MRLAAGDQVRLPNGLSGVVLWLYSNPLHPGAELDRAAVEVAGPEVWSVNVAHLTAQPQTQGELPSAA